MARRRRSGKRRKITHGSAYSVDLDVPRITPASCELLHLPTEILSEVIAFLPFDELRRLRLVCSHLRALVYHDHRVQLLKEHSNWVDLNEDKIDSEREWVSETNGAADSWLDEIDDWEGHDEGGWLDVDEGDWHAKPIRICEYLQPTKKRLLDDAD